MQISVHDRMGVGCTEHVVCEAGVITNMSCQGSGLFRHSGSPMGRVSALSITSARRHLGYANSNAAAFFCHGGSFEQRSRHVCFQRV